MLGVAGPDAIHWMEQATGRCPVAPAAPRRCRALSRVDTIGIIGDRNLARVEAVGVHARDRPLGHRYWRAGPGRDFPCLREITAGHWDALVGGNRYPGHVTWSNRGWKRRRDHPLSAHRGLLGSASPDQRGGRHEALELQGAHDQVWLTYLRFSCRRKREGPKGPTYATASWKRLFYCATPSAAGGIR